MKMSEASELLGLLTNMTTPWKDETILHYNPYKPHWKEWRRRGWLPFYGLLANCAILFVFFALFILELILNIMLLLVVVISVLLSEERHTYHTSQSYT